jgi:hypothetical protein
MENISGLTLLLEGKERRRMKRKNVRCHPLPSGS